MKNFWSYVKSEHYCVGCTGQTVYVFNKNEEEIAKFKDIIYAYNPAISPDESVLFIKSTAGMIAVYSLENLCLLKKFRFSKADISQDEGYCFSTDSKYYINIESVADGLQCAISWYDTKTFEKVFSFQLEQDIVINELECTNDNRLYVVGFCREKNQSFVALVNETGIIESQEITELEREYYLTEIRMRRSGFTEKSWKWSFSNFDYEKIKSGNHSLEKLFDYYKNKESD